MKHKLKKPFNFGSEAIAEVEIKEEYDAGDIVRVQNATKKGDGDTFLELICIGTGFPAPKAAKIPAKDALEISRMVSDFFGIGAE